MGGWDDISDVQNGKRHSRRCSYPRGGLRKLFLRLTGPAKMPNRLIA